VTRSHQRIVGVVGLLAMVVGAWLLLARIGGFAQINRKLGTRVPGDRFSYTFIPAGKFCTPRRARCVFVNLDDRVMAPVLENDAEGATFTIANSATARSDFKAEHDLMAWEIVVVDGDVLHMRSVDVADGRWLEFTRRR
jgi:hypothetical protein